MLPASVRRLVRSLLSTGLALLATAASPVVEGAQASDREVELRFLHGGGGAAIGYRAYVTDQTTVIGDVIDVGYIASDPDGIHRTTIVLDSATSYTVGMSAYDEFGESELSNQIGIPAVACDTTSCDDGNSCTIDACDALGCLNPPAADGSACDDGLADTVDDQCLAGVCEGIVLACIGNNDCDDGNMCNGAEVCEGGTVCLSGEPPDCGAPTQCTEPACDPNMGCLSVPRPDGTLCDDGSSYTIDDACVAGICRGAAREAALAVTGIAPNVVASGSVDVEIRGYGFVNGASLRFENGAGPAPRVRSLRVIDAQTLVARIAVSRKGPKRSRHWDVVVSLRDGTTARLENALRVDP